MLYSRSTGLTREGWRNFVLLRNALIGLAGAWPGLRWLAELEPGLRLHRGGRRSIAWGLSTLVGGGSRSSTKAEQLVASNGPVEAGNARFSSPRCIDTDDVYSPRISICIFCYAENCGPLMHRFRVSPVCCPLSYCRVLRVPSEL